MISAMKARRPMPADQWIAMALLVLLAVLAVVLWFADPSHRPDGRSRIDWPVAEPKKP